MNPNSPEEVLRRSVKAQQFLQDPLMRDTLDLMEREIMEAWIICPARDSEGREWLWRQIVATRKFRDLLRGTMEAGKLATEEIARKKNVFERAQEFTKGRFGWQA